MPAPEEIANIFANIGAATARTPESAQAAGSVQEQTQANLARLYRKRQKEAQKKAKKLGTLKGIARLISSAIPGPVDDVVLQTLANELGGAEGSFVENLAGETLNAGLGELASFAGDKGAAFLERTSGVPEGVQSPSLKFKRGLAETFTSPEGQATLSGIADTLRYNPTVAGADIPAGLNPEVVAGIEREKMLAMQLAQDAAFKERELGLSERRVEQGDRSLDLEGRRTTTAEKAQESEAKATERRLDQGDRSLNIEESVASARMEAMQAEIDLANRELEQQGELGKARIGVSAEGNDIQRQYNQARIAAMERAETVEQAAVNARMLDNLASSMAVEGENMLGETVFIPNPTFDARAKIVAELYPELAPSILDLSDIWHRYNRAYQDRSKAVGAGEESEEGEGTSPGWENVGNTGIQRRRRDAN